MKTRILILCLILVTALLVQVLLAIFSKLDDIYSNQTKILCAEYAARDHEKEFVPERWALVKDLYTKEDWFKSCISHSAKNL